MSQKRPDDRVGFPIGWEQFHADLAKAPRYHTVNDVVDALGGGLGGQNRLIDAYCQGWLGVDDARLLEGDASRLSCWLLARLVRVSLAGAAAPR